MVRDESQYITISKIRIGSGDNYEYYEPSSTATALKGDLGYEFYILDKDLLEDKMTISFHTVISENFGGFDIREVGLYETINGEDRLFAISTQQPFVKPTLDDNYLISVDYYMFLRIENVADFYDRIILDPENSLVTEADLEDMMRTIVFTQGSLITQIGNNSRIIGYNRATQLYDKISANKESFSYLTAYKNYTTLLDYIDDDKFIGYWVFNYSRRKEAGASIVDISKKGNNLSTEKPMTTYKREYEGFMSMLEFPDPNYFTLSTDVNTSLLNIDETEDAPFTMIFALNALHKNTKRTLLAKSNYAVGSHTFEINELPDRSLQVRLFSDANNYLTFTTDRDVLPESTGHSIVLVYDPMFKEFNSYICGKKCFFDKVETGTYTHMNSAPTTLYAYTCTPSVITYADSDEYPTKILNADGTSYEGTAWTLFNDELLYELKTAHPYADGNVNTDILYAWTYGNHTIYTKTPVIESLNTKLYTDDYKEFDDPAVFKIIASGSNFIIIYEEDPLKIAEYDAEHNIPSKILYAWRYSEDTQVIWTNNLLVPTLLYDSTGNIYRGEDWKIVDDLPRYLNLPSTYNEEQNMTASIVGVTSYVTGLLGDPENTIDAQVGLVSVFREGLTDEEARVIALNIEGTMGKNPCIDKH